MSAIGTGEHYARNKEINIQLCLILFIKGITYISASTSIYSDYFSECEAITSISTNIPGKTNPATSTTDLAGNSPLVWAPK